jgi:hypothetical protein
VVGRTVPRRRTGRRRGAGRAGGGRTEEKTRIVECFTVGDFLFLPPSPRPGFCRREFDDAFSSRSRRRCCSDLRSGFGGALDSSLDWNGMERNEWNHFSCATPNPSFSPILHLVVWWWMDALSE